MVVAATGTGKTVIAAFDYRVICNQQGGKPRLLFVAHREEILKQALRTCRITDTLPVHVYTTDYISKLDRSLPHSP